jgi:DNA helicase-2/ATP-dependent DNA helicase PcrA
MRAETEGLTLREIIEVVLQRSGLVEHYRAERDGADRIENLEELVNAARASSPRKASAATRCALPIDELGAIGLRPSPASHGAGIRAVPEVNERRPDYVPPMPRRARRWRRLAAFLTHAALESGDNQAQAARTPVQLMTVHAA